MSARDQATDAPKTLIELEADVAELLRLAASQERVTGEHWVSQRIRAAHRASQQATDAQGGAIAEVTAYRQQELTATVRIIPGLNGAVPFGIGSLLYAHPPVAPLPPSVANVEAISAEELGEIMQEEWGEICSDTDCHPLDISKRGRNTFYSPRHWTAAIARRLSERTALSSAPEFAKQMDGDNALREEAIANIRFALDFAYKNGLHEFGYDPLTLLTTPSNEPANAASDEAQP